MKTAEDWYRLAGLLSVATLVVFAIWNLLPTTPREKR